MFGSRSLIHSQTCKHSFRNSSSTRHIYGHGLNAPYSHLHGTTSKSTGNMNALVKLHAHNIHTTNTQPCCWHTSHVLSCTHKFTLYLFLQLHLAALFMFTNMTGPYTLYLLHKHTLILLDRLLAYIGKLKYYPSIAHTTFIRYRQTLRRMDTAHTVLAFTCSSWDKTDVCTKSCWGQKTFIKAYTQQTHQLFPLPYIPTCRLHVNRHLRINIVSFVYLRSAK